MLHCSEPLLGDVQYECLNLKVLSFNWGKLSCTDCVYLFD